MKKLLFLSMFLLNSLNSNACGSYRHIDYGIHGHGRTDPDYRPQSALPIERQEVITIKKKYFEPNILYTFTIVLPMEWGYAWKGDNDILNAAINFKFPGFTFKNMKIDTRNWETWYLFEVSFVSDRYTMVEELEDLFIRHLYKHAYLG